VDPKRAARTLSGTKNTSTLTTVAASAAHKPFLLFCISLVFATFPVFAYAFCKLFNAEAFYLLRGRTINTTFGG